MMTTNVHGAAFMRHHKRTAAQRNLAWKIAAGVFSRWEVRAILQVARAGFFICDWDRAAHLPADLDRALLEADTTIRRCRHCSIELGVC